MSAFLTRTITLGVAVAAFGAVWAGVQSSVPADQASGPFLVGEAHAAEKATIIPAPRVSTTESGKRAVAIFGVSKLSLNIPRA